MPRADHRFVALLQQIGTPRRNPMVESRLPITDPQHWRARANEARAVAEHLTAALPTAPVRSTTPSFRPGQREMIYSLPNPDRDSPASYLRKHLTVNAGVFDYRRVTARFFVVSGVRRGSVFYSRCNFRAGKLGCMFIQYPQTEKRAWDRIVTRMSLSLR